MNQNGHLQSKVGEPADAGILKRELPANVYRADASGHVDMVVSETDMPGPNGIAFSPDYKKVYIVTRGDIAVFDVGTNGKLSNQKLFATFTVDGVRCGTDGFRVDVDGNLWCAANAGSAHLGYSGVTLLDAGGKIDRANPPARVGFESHLRRTEAESHIHHRELVDLRPHREHAGRRSGLVPPSAGALRAPQSSDAPIRARVSKRRPVTAPKMSRRRAPCTQLLLLRFARRSRCRPG